MSWSVVLHVMMFWSLPVELSLCQPLQCLPTAAQAGPVYTLDALHHRSTTVQVTSTCSKYFIAAVQRKPHREMTNVYLECLQTADSLSPLDYWGREPCPAHPSAPCSWNITRTQLP